MLVQWVVYVGHSLVHANFLSHSAQAGYNKDQIHGDSFSSLDGGKTLSTAYQTGGNPVPQLDLYHAIVPLSIGRSATAIPSYPTTHNYGGTSLSLELQQTTDSRTASKPETTTYTTH